jgi:hypothetical protein
VATATPRSFIGLPAPPYWTSDVLLATRRRNLGMSDGISELWIVDLDALLRAAGSNRRRATLQTET